MAYNSYDRDARGGRIRSKGNEQRHASQRSNVMNDQAGTNERDELTDATKRTKRTKQAQPPAPAAHDAPARQASQAGQATQAPQASPGSQASLKLFSQDEWERIVGALGFSPRQEQVARCLLSGMADREISGRIGISLPTVRTHMWRMFEKYDLASRVDLVLLIFHAFRQGEDGDGN